ncbi:MAG TPA: sugar transferase [Sedimentisphaerales bacterium]|nr:sugar transferase [Sedimentisphaerales bacterium]
MTSYRKKQGYSPYMDSWSKRCFDIVICLLLLPPGLFVMGLAGLSILIREGRPVFFWHYRVGKNGRLFWIPKLRTLRVDANPYEPSAESDNASLVTVTGKFFRRHKLDELPQLFSVLTGHMSLVGPRPELPGVAVTYEPLQRKRLLVKPGITGLWQVLGDRKLAMHKDMKYDLYYMRKGSLWLDMKILAMTVAFVLNPKRKLHL